MKKIILSVSVVFFVFFGLINTAFACGDSKDDVFFNKGRNFFVVNLTHEKPKSTFTLDGVQGTIQKIGNGVTMTYKGVTQTGKLYAVARCLESATFVSWGNESLNPDALGEDVGREFRMFISNPKPKPVKYTIRDVTVTVSADAKDFIEAQGGQIYQTGRGSILFTPPNGGVTDLEGLDKENVFVMISVKEMQGAKTLIINLTEKNGKARQYRFDFKANDFIEITN